MGQIDKDRNKSDAWLAGKLLLAMPGMGDPRFQKAVIYVCAHDEQGAMGLVVNHVLPDIKIDELYKQLNIEQKSKDENDRRAITIMGGGPVETARGFILHSSEFERPDTVKINETFSLTGTVDAIKAVAQGEGPDQLLFMLGYAGWSAGQLDQEIQQNAWLVTEPEPDLIFTTNPEDKWNNAIDRLGINPAMLSHEAGRA